MTPPPRRRQAPRRRERRARRASSGYFRRTELVALDVGRMRKIHPFWSSATNRLPWAPTATPVERATRAPLLFWKPVRKSVHCADGLLQLTAVAGIAPLNGTNATCGGSSGIEPFACHEP